MGTIDLMIKKEHVYNYDVSLNDCLANYIKGDRHFIDGIRRGVTACREGRMKPWSEIKKELAID